MRIESSGVSGHVGDGVPVAAWLARLRSRAGAEGSG